MASGRLNLFEPNFTERIGTDARKSAPRKNVSSGLNNYSRAGRTTETL
jgi:hypothetical protein